MRRMCMGRWIESIFPCYIPFVSTVCFVGDGALVNGTPAVTMGAVATEGKVLTTFSLVTGSVLITGVVVACNLAVTAALLTGASGIGITNSNQCTEGTTDEIQHVFWIIQLKSHIRRNQETILCAINGKTNSKYCDARCFVNENNQYL